MSDSNKQDDQPSGSDQQNNVVALVPGAPQYLPLLPLRDVVVFPHMVIPLFVGRAKSIKALENAMGGDRKIMLLAQKTAAQDEPEPADLYRIGCIANILQMLKLPDGTVKVLVEGAERAAAEEIRQDPESFAVRVRIIKSSNGDSHKVEAMRRAVITQFEQYTKINKKVPAETLASVTAIEDAGRMADSITAHLPTRIEHKQEILELDKVDDRIERLLSQLEAELDIIQVEKRIRGRVKRQMEKNQREYYLNEQVKAIQKELGDGEDGADIDEIEKRIKSAGMSKEALKKAQSEFSKLKLMSPMSAEATVVRNYIDTLCNLPWKKKTRLNRNLADGEKMLNKDHYGLEKVKERIVEYLAVQQRVDKVKAPILCLVGAPGVGKTSLGESIARATNRKFVRVALGGIRDEAEVRGHRRTYIGSLPGKILQSLSKVGVRNPLFLLDEVDKLGQDFRGDPSSALLEVLDPEQNHTFQDHYVEVDFDLSDVMFVATANTFNIPAPLLDRMEVIRLAGYTEDEKVNIALRYLLPKQLKANGLKPSEISVTEAGVRDIVRYYTREAGVRNLDREVSRICRKVVKMLVLKKRRAKVVVNAKNLDRFLGVRRHKFGVKDAENRIGQVTGLAWTEVGGEILTVESVIMPGNGKITTTGSLGDVMKESIEAARSLVRARSDRLGINPDVFEKTDIHVHVPEGATPKDGPSAGIAMTTALASSLTGIPVRCEVCMTGEITLRGEVLPIGGLKEKLLAAVRGGLTKALIPEENVKDLTDIPDNIKNRIEITPVRWIDQVLEHALAEEPKPVNDESNNDKALPSGRRSGRSEKTVVKH